MSGVTEWDRLLRRVGPRIVDLTVTLCRQDRTTRAGGPTSRSAPLVYRVDAADVMDRITHTLRGIRSAWLAEHGERFVFVAESAPLLTFAREQLSWIAHHPMSSAWWAALDEAERMAAEVVDIPPERFALGPCQAHLSAAEVCGNPLWAVEDEDFAECERCGSVVDVRARRSERITAAASYVGPLSVIVATLDKVGVPVSLSAARKWTQRKDRKTGRPQLESHWTDDDGTRLYSIGDVAEAAARGRRRAAN